MSFSPFIYKPAALRFAKEKAQELCNHNYIPYKEEDYGKDQGQIFFVSCSCEGDCVRVVKTYLNTEQV